MGILNSLFGKKGKTLTKTKVVRKSTSKPQPTINQLKDILDRKGIYYKASAKKDELLELVDGTKKSASVGKSKSGEY